MFEEPTLPFFSLSSAKWNPHSSTFTLWLEPLILLLSRPVSGTWMELQDGIKGSFDSRAPRPQDMAGNGGQGPDQRGNSAPAKPFWGEFQPRLTDLTEEKLDLSSNSLLTPLTWFRSNMERVVSSYSIIWTLGLRMYGCWIGRYGLWMAKTPGMLWR